LNSSLLNIYPFKNKKRIVAFLIDEAQIQIGSTEAWLLVAIEPLHRGITCLSMDDIIHVLSTMQ
jgi:hypothetical protein